MLWTIRADRKGYFLHGPLLIGAMIGMLFVVTRLRNSAMGIPALFAFTFIAGLMLLSRVRAE